MCRSIKTLRNSDVIASDEEIRAAARQFVRKVSGFGKPSSRHEAAFEVAVDEITLASQRLLESIAGNLVGAGHRAHAAATSS
jgi:hypothetical protein